MNPQIELNSQPPILEVLTKANTSRQNMVDGHLYIVIKNEMISITSDKKMASKVSEIGHFLQKTLNNTTISSHDLSRIEHSYKQLQANTKNKLVKTLVGKIRFLFFQLFFLKTTLFKTPLTDKDNDHSFEPTLAVYEAEDNQEKTYLISISGPIPEPKDYGKKMYSGDKAHRQNTYVSKTYTDTKEEEIALQKLQTNHLLKDNENKLQHIVKQLEGDPLTLSNQIEPKSQEVLKAEFLKLSENSCLHLNKLQEEEELQHVDLEDAFINDLQGLLALNGLLFTGFGGVNREVHQAISFIHKVFYDNLLLISPLIKEEFDFNQIKTKFIHAIQEAVKNNTDTLSFTIEEFELIYGSEIKRKWRDFSPEIAELVIAYENESWKKASNGEAEERLITYQPILFQKDSEKNVKLVQNIVARILNSQAFEAALRLYCKSQFE